MIFADFSGELTADHASGFLPIFKDDFSKSFRTSGADPTGSFMKILSFPGKVLFR
jgi:hypothetical protein